MSSMLTLITAATLAVGVPGKPVANCDDEKMSEECAAAITKRIGDIYGIPTIEQHQAAKAEVARIFIIDDYGRDILAVEFMRGANTDPQLIVEFPDKLREKARAPFRLPIAERAFDEVIHQGRFVTRSLVQIPEKNEKGSIYICAHPWTVYAEFVDAPEGNDPPAMRRRKQNSCADGLVVPYGFHMTEKATELISWCAILDPKGLGNSAEVLSTCGRLAGDRSAAAHVRNRLEEMRRYVSSNSEEVRWLFDLSPTIVWNGNKIGRAQGKDFVAKLVESGDNLYLGTLSVTGVSGTRVTSNGYLQRDTDSGYEIADVDFVWKSDGYDFNIIEARVGPFQKVQRK